MTRLALILAAVLALSACSDRVANDRNAWSKYSAGVGKVMNQP